MGNDTVVKLRKQMEELDLDGFLVGSKANMYYLSGFTGTYARVLITKKGKFIFADGRYFEQLKTQSPDFEVIDNHMLMAQTIGEFITEKRLGKIGFESEEMNVADYLELVDTNAELIPTKHIIDQLRMIKAKEEVNKIREAGHIADKTFEYIQKYIKPGMTEKQVANEIDRYGLANGADAVAFETIVASGIRSSLPHGHASNKEIKNNEMIILDFGFMVDHYYSDITRTIVLGEVNPKLKLAYDVTLKAQELAIEACKTGVGLREIDRAARNYITNQGFGRQFLHGTGHGIGLTVHEFPLLNQDSEETIQKGMTFTVEPGIYLEGLGGIRIEDDIWIDDDGQVNILTESTKKWVEL